MDSSDVVAIHDLLSHYGYVVDDAAWDRLDEVFAPDGVFDISVIGKGTPTGLDELRRCYAELDHPLAHHTTNAVVEQNGPHRARVRCRYLVVYPDGRTGTGEYRDEVVLRPEGWRLQRRTVVRRSKAART
jgi:3-phenylpropionate/cinnamic acid dioxygenase small subunit